MFAKPAWDETKLNHRIQFVFLLGNHIIHRNNCNFFGSDFQSSESVGFIANDSVEEQRPNESSSSFEETLARYDPEFVNR